MSGEPLSDFQEGQWWVKELDAMVVDGTPDQKRAVAVVHNLLNMVHLLTQQKFTVTAEPVTEQQRKDRMSPTFTISMEANCAKWPRCGCPHQYECIGL